MSLVSISTLRDTGPVAQRQSERGQTLGSQMQALTNGADDASLARLVRVRVDVEAGA